MDYKSIAKAKQDQPLAIETDLLTLRQESLALILSVTKGVRIELQEKTHVIPSTVTDLKEKEMVDLFSKESNQVAYFNDEAIDRLFDVLNLPLLAFNSYTCLVNYAGDNAILLLDVIYSDNFSLNLEIIFHLAPCVLLLVCIFLSERLRGLSEAFRRISLN